MLLRSLRTNVPSTLVSLQTTSLAPHQVTYWYFSYGSQLLTYQSIFLLLFWTSIICTFSNTNVNYSYVLRNHTYLYMYIYINYFFIAVLHPRFYPTIHTVYSTRTTLPFIILTLSLIWHRPRRVPMMVPRVGSDLVYSDRISFSIFAINTF